MTLSNKCKIVRLLIEYPGLTVIFTRLILNKIFPGISYHASKQSAY
jgi:hypothetical protein